MAGVVKFNLRVVLCALGLEEKSGMPIGKCADELRLCTDGGAGQPLHTVSDVEILAVCGG